MAARKTGRGARRRRGAAGDSPSPEAVALEGALAKIVGHLRALDVRFALVGGLAVSARCAPRFTRDADLAIAVENDAEAEALIFKLAQLGYRVDASVEQQRTKRLATIRLIHSALSGVYVDLLFASSGIERELVARADQLKLAAGVVLPIASIGELLALKILSRGPRRLQDDLDLQALLEASSARDRRVAERNLELIRERGYARGKNLKAEWKRVLTKFAK